MREDDAVLHSIVRKLQQRSNINVSIHITDRFPGERLIGGKYSLETNKITIYLEEIKKQCVLLFGSDDYLFEYFTVIVAHELGHAADKTLAVLAKQRANALSPNKKKQISLKIEDNAWRFAKKLLPELTPILSTVRVKSMELYVGEGHK
ncbi:hypothetical protein [Guptibacillus spartinae]|uniref:hypothetical protein n=1 Tax=Guptibacillus spartinae TaxID=3025679 RepID=UPI0023615B79|nr:hypothetical protein [Pseudalkalibacillus spartinae]